MQRLRRGTALQVASPHLMWPYMAGQTCLVPGHIPGWFGSLLGYLRECPGQAPTSCALGPFWKVSGMGSWAWATSSSGPLRLPLICPVPGDPVPVVLSVSLGLQINLLSLFITKVPSLVIASYKLWWQGLWECLLIDSYILKHSMSPVKIAKNTY